MKDVKITIDLADDLKSEGIDVDWNYLSLFDNLGQFMAWHVIPHLRMFEYFSIHGFQLGRSWQGQDYSPSHEYYETLPLVSYFPLYVSDNGDRTLPTDFITYINSMVAYSYKTAFNSWYSPSTTKTLIDFRNLIIGNINGPSLLYSVGWFSGRLFMLSTYIQVRWIARTVDKIRETKLWEWFENT